MVLNSETVFVVPMDKQTFRSIRRFHPPEITAAPAGAVNPLLSSFLKRLNKGFGVFALTRAWWLRVKRSIKSFKLKIEIHEVKNEKDFTLKTMGNSETSAAEVDEAHSSSVRTRTRPAVRHNHARVNARLHVRR